MTRPSSVDRLPAAVREAIGALRERGHTIDEILAHLADLQTEVSRSALGRHVKSLDAIGAQMKRSRVVAEALVRQLGDAPESKTARLNIELLHSAVLDVMMRAAEGEENDGRPVDGRAQAALDGNPEGVMMLAKALDHLGRAQKSSVDSVLAIEKRAAERARVEAVKAVDEVAKAGGLTEETVATIKARIFGVKADAKG
jgi:biotin operon repressor